MIRAERAGGEEAIHAVHVAAFGREDEAKIADDLRASDAFIPELSLVADEERVVAGHVIVSRGHVAPSGEPILLLGPIGVLPERQGEGIGSALVETALEGARSLGASCVALLGSPGYYGRFGFVHAEPLGPLPLAEWPSEAFQVAIVDPTAGVPPGQVVYPPAFGL